MKNSTVAERRRGVGQRFLVAGAAVSGLFALFVVLPLADFPFPLSTAMLPTLDGAARIALNAVNVTGVLVVVAALTVVALVRKLSYGIGAVITVTIGAPLTTALVRLWADGWVPASALPSGQVTAVSSVVIGATLVATPTLLPMLRGLGAIVVASISGAAIVSGSSTIVGVVAATLVTVVWWAVASSVMLFTPAASEREAHNPLDTAAMAVQRRMGRF